MRRGRSAREMLERNYQKSALDELSVVLFAGGGGSDTGISCMTGKPVDIAINHDADAIRMHKTNHPWTRHLQEDVFAVDPKEVCADQKVGILWASPDCTHFSKARGGVPVKKEIRGLSWVVIKWALAVRPRVMFMENVEEIQTWGPCIETPKGLQPDPARAGETFKGFLAMLTSGIAPDHPALKECCEFLHVSEGSTEAKRLIAGLGYDFGSKILCAADYGVPTIRKRWFAVFRCDGQPVKFPEPTHAKDGKDGLPRWRSAAEVIDWALPCPSIFASKAEIAERYGLKAVRPLADNTMRRVIRGVDRFTIKSGKPFLVECNHGGDGHTRSIETPVNTITGRYTGGVCKSVLSPLTMSNVSGAAGTDCRAPLNTARTSGGGGQMLIASSLIQYHTERTESARVQGLGAPLQTVDGSNRYGLASANLIEYYSNGRPLDISEPIHTQTAKDRDALMITHICKFKGDNIGQAPAEPLQTVTASAGEFAAVKVTIERCKNGAGLGFWPKVRALLNTYCGYDLGDDEIILLWISGAAYFISDIGLRMLTPRELYNAMGFPPDYIIDRDYTGKEYKRSAQVARCGNAVCPPVAGALVAANLKDCALPHYIGTLSELWERVSA